MPPPLPPVTPLPSTPKILLARRMLRCLASAQSSININPSNDATAPKPGQIIELECTGLSAGGDGVCRRVPNGRFVVFVPRALPGERLTARIVRSKNTHAQGVKERTVRASVHSVMAPCRSFEENCGGCTWQHLAYDMQLAAKHETVFNHLRNIGGVSEPSRVLKPPIACQPEIYRYRNKMEFSFQSGPARGKTTTTMPDELDAASAVPLRAGLHRPGSNRDVLPVSACLLQTQTADDIYSAAMELCTVHGLQAWEHPDRNTQARKRTTPKGKATFFRRKKEGSLQHVVLRHSLAQNQYLINFVTSRDAREELAPVAQALTRRFATQLSGVVNSVSLSGRPLGERRFGAEHVLWGSPFLVEKVCGIELEISANSFFQTNTHMAEILYRLVERAVAPNAQQQQQRQQVLDLYCGTGSISLALAKNGRCRNVIGVEIMPSAIEDARRNARRNGLADRARFVCGDVAALAGKLRELVPTPDVVVVDPARPGLELDVVQYLRECAARRLVYVSCNSATQARDVKLLCARGNDGFEGNGGGMELRGAPYVLESVQAVDLFPHTPHVETVAVLVR